MCTKSHVLGVSSVKLGCILTSVLSKRCNQEIIWEFYTASKEEVWFIFDHNDTKLRYSIIVV